VRDLVLRSQFVNFSLTQAEQFSELPNCKGGFSSFQIIDHVDPLLATMRFSQLLKRQMTIRFSVGGAWETNSAK
jgi:hypothetical protein